jgi:hypothetical protein
MQQKFFLIRDNLSQFSPFEGNDILFDCYFNFYKNKKENEIYNDFFDNPSFLNDMDEDQKRFIENIDTHVKKSKYKNDTKLLFKSICSLLVLFPATVLWEDENTRKKDNEKNNLYDTDKIWDVFEKINIHNFCASVRDAPSYLDKELEIAYLINFEVGTPTPYLSNNKTLIPFLKIKNNPSNRHLIKFAIENHLSFEEDPLIEYSEIEKYKSFWQQGFLVYLTRLSIGLLTCSVFLATVCTIFPKIIGTYWILFFYIANHFIIIDGLMIDAMIFESRKKARKTGPCYQNFSFIMKHLKEDHNGEIFLNYSLVSGERHIEFDLYPGENVCGRYNVAKEINRGSKIYDYVGYNFWILSFDNLVWEQGIREGKNNKIDPDSFCFPLFGFKFIFSRTQVNHAIVLSCKEKGWDISFDRGRIIRHNANNREWLKAQTVAVFFVKKMGL